MKSFSRLSKWLLLAASLFLIYASIPISSQNIPKSANLDYKDFVLRQADYHRRNVVLNEVVVNDPVYFLCFGFFQVHTPQHQYPLLGWSGARIHKGESQILAQPLTVLSVGDFEFTVLIKVKQTRSERHTLTEDPSI